MSYRMNPDAPVTRRNFLFVGTVATGAVAVGAAGWGVLGSLAPSADVVAANAPIEIDLAGISEGTEIVFKIDVRPIIVRHRRPEEIAATEKADFSTLPDPFSLDMYGNKVGPADDHLRRATPDGRFIALLALCSHLDCVVLATPKEENAWFCPCCASWYDASGRLRKGVGPHNLMLAATRYVGNSKLLIAPTRTAARGEAFARS
jgi:ubiquinol-cytochrome c reductase iron-sulfur subunit